MTFKTNIQLFPEDENFLSCRRQLVDWRGKNGNVIYETDTPETFKAGLYSKV